jgi:hypothetical protein
VLASLPANLHADGLHADHLGRVETVVSACSLEHPPRFEAAIASEREPCAGCLVQLQQRGLGEAATRVATPLASGAAVAIAPMAPARSAAVTPAPSRGPPSLRG